nr:Gfo/Idh/MocA family oxidoreductase [Pseudonocardia sp. AL041005-10]
MLDQVEAEDLTFPEAVRRGVMCEPPRGVPAMGPLLDAVAALDRDIYAIVEQDMYPCPRTCRCPSPGAPTPTSPAAGTAPSRSASRGPEPAGSGPRPHRARRLTMSELRVAVIGVGTMGAFHVDSLSRRVRGARVTVVSDADADRASEVAAAVGARVETDPLAAVAADDVDSVVLASPGFAHEKQVLACLEAGKPVLCEKPLTMDEPSALAVVRAEAATGRRLVQVGFMRRFDREYAALRALVASGGIGDPLMLHCVHRNPAVPEHFTSVFAMADSVVHEVDCTRFLLGRRSPRSPC